MNEPMDEMQRLVDDELDPRERADYLLYVDAMEPESWREIALRYVEAQELKRAMGAKSIEEVEPNVVAKSDVRTAVMKIAAMVAVALVLGFSIGRIQPGAPGTGNLVGEAGTNRTPEVEVPEQPGNAVPLVEDDRNEVQTDTPERKSVYLAKDLGDRGLLVLPVSYVPQQDDSF